MMRTLFLAGVLAILGIYCQVVAAGELPSSEAASPETGLEAQTGGVRALLIPRAQTLLSGELSARIEELRVDVGDSFKKGAVLVRFDCSLYRAQLEKARAELREMEKTLAVNQRLGKLGSISELEVATAAARVDQARAEVALKRHSVNRCIIRAPYAGGVVKREAQPFQYATPGQPLLEIIATRDLDLQVFIPSRWVRHITPGTAFRVHIDEVDKVYDARVTALGARVDPVSQTVEIRARVQGQHPELLAGMSGAARFDPK